MCLVLGPAPVIKTILRGEALTRALAKHDAWVRAHADGDVRVPFVDDPHAGESSHRPPSADDVWDTAPIPMRGRRSAEAAS